MGVTRTHACQCSAPHLCAPHSHSTVTARVRRNRPPFVHLMSTARHTSKGYTHEAQAVGSHAAWASPRLTWQVINGAALLAHTPAKPTLARYTRSLHTIQLAHTATACKDAAHSANTAAWSRPIGHWRRLLEACAREVSEAGRIAGSRCFQACFRARPS